MQHTKIPLVFAHYLEIVHVNQNIKDKLSWLIELMKLNEIKIECKFIFFCC